MQLREILILTEAGGEEIYQKYYYDIPYKEFFQIVSADPTQNSTIIGDEVKKIGPYAKWLLNIYKNRALKLEDLYKATEYLSLFYKHKDKIPLDKRDIGRYKSIQDLFVNAIQPLRELEAEKGGITKKEQAKSENLKDADIEYNDDTWTVVSPNSHKASCAWGEGTEWCTAAEGIPKFFDFYTGYGQLLIFINKKNGNKYQLHPELNEFKDGSDRDVDLRSVINSKKAENKGVVNWILNNYTIKNKYKHWFVVKELSDAIRSMRQGFESERYEDDYPEDVELPEKFENFMEQFKIEPEALEELLERYSTIIERHEYEKKPEDYAVFRRIYYHGADFYGDMPGTPIDYLPSNAREMIDDLNSDSAFDKGKEKEEVIQALGNLVNGDLTEIYPPDENYQDEVKVIDFASFVDELLHHYKEGRIELDHIKPEFSEEFEGIKNN